MVAGMMESSIVVDVYMKNPVIIFIINSVQNINDSRYDNQQILHSRHTLFTCIILVKFNIKILLQFVRLTNLF